MQSLSKCLNEAMDGFHATDEVTEKVKYLLDWMAETCHEIESYDDYNL